MDETKLRELRLKKPHPLHTKRMITTCGTCVLEIQQQLLRERDEARAERDEAIAEVVHALAEALGAAAYNPTDTSSVAKYVRLLAEERDKANRKLEAVRRWVDAGHDETGELITILAQLECVCGGPSTHPCGPSCRYPYTDQSRVAQSEGEGE